MANYFFLSGFIANGHYIITFILTPFWSFFKRKEDLLGELHSKDKALHNKQQELNEIYRSKAWRAVQQYRKLTEQFRKIIPPK